MTIGGGVALSGDGFGLATLDFKINYPLNNSPLSLGLDLSAGGYDGEYDEVPAMGIIVSAVPTVRVHLGKRIDAVCGVGYTYCMDDCGICPSGGYVSVKFGLKFHSAQKKGEVQRPNRDRERNFHVGKWKFNMSKEEQE